MKSSERRLAMQMDDKEKKINLAIEDPVSLDRSKVDELRAIESEGSPDLLQEIVGLFEKNVPRRLEALRRAVHEKDSEAICKEAHELKSSTCYLGAVGIKRLCDHAEALASMRSFEELDAICGSLECEYQRVLSALR